MIKPISSLLLENKKDILENVKQAKMYVSQGKLSEEDLKKLIEIDPTPTRKFVGWMAKVLIAEKVNLDDLKKTIDQYSTFLNKNKAKTKDINQFKSFADLQNEIDQINNSGEDVSAKDLENDYETITDNADLLIVSPHTHEASRKLGLSKFAFRDCEEEKDSAWCTTYKAPDHFNDYYYTRNVTFYYIRVKSSQMIEKLKKAFPKKYKSLEVVALVVLDNGEVDGYDGLDNSMSKKDIKTFTNIIGIS